DGAFAGQSLGTGAVREQDTRAGERESSLAFVSLVVPAGHVRREEPLASGSGAEAFGEAQRRLVYALAFVGSRGGRAGRYRFPRARFGPEPAAVGVAGDAMTGAAERESHLQGEGEARMQTRRLWVRVIGGMLVGALLVCVALRHRQIQTQQKQPF